MVKDIAFTAYPSNDVAGARRWYVEDGVEKYNEAHFGSGCFSLTSAEWTSRMPGSASSIYFEVDDVEDVVASLQANGVRIESRFEGPLCKQASFCDPDGNKVTIHESTVRQS
jgi:predicted enzyme related to lactoylglutathione lyase